MPTNCLVSPKAPQLLSAVAVALLLAVSIAVAIVPCAVDVDVAVAVATAVAAFAVGGFVFVFVFGVVFVVRRKDHPRQRRCVVGSIQEKPIDLLLDLLDDVFPAGVAGAGLDTDLEDDPERHDAGNPGHDVPPDHLEGVIGADLVELDIAIGIGIAGFFRCSLRLQFNHPGDLFLDRRRLGQSASASGWQIGGQHWGRPRV